MAAAARHQLAKKRLDLARIPPNSQRRPRTGPSCRNRPSGTCHLELRRLWESLSPRGPRLEANCGSGTRTIWRLPPRPRHAARRCRASSCARPDRESSSAAEVVVHVPWGIRVRCSTTASASGHRVGVASGPRRSRTRRHAYGHRSQRGRPVRYARTGRSVLLGVLCAALLCALASCSSPDPDSSVRGSGRGKRIPYWVPGKTPTQVARSMNVTIPARAADLRAAYQRGFQDDNVLLAFTLPKSDTRAFIRSWISRAPCCTGMPPSPRERGTPRPPRSPISV